MARPGLIAALAAAAALSACGLPKPAVNVVQPIFQKPSGAEKMLAALPPPEHPVAVAVYNFTDQTGQFKLTDTGQNLSRAVSQGGTSMLIRSLMNAGGRKWFTIVEREQLKDLLNERQIIREMRSQYLGENGVNPQALPSLLFAGVLLEGGIVSYDTNSFTGGLGATLLGIGATAKYQQDTVTVYLRAVSVKTGEVLASITTSKTITSYALDGNVFRYIASDKLLETENGFTTNEPEQLALQQAIDKAVYGLVLEGVDLKLWSFADTNAGWPMLSRYHQERDGQISAAEAESLVGHGRAKPIPSAPPKLSDGSKAMIERAKSVIKDDDGRKALGTAQDLPPPVTDAGLTGSMGAPTANPRDQSGPSSTEVKAQ